MKPMLRTAVAAVVVLASACAPVQAASTPDTTRITVTGTASVPVTADRVRLQVAVETEEASAAAASRENARLMNRVLEAIRPAAGPGARIETQGFQLTPRYRRRPAGDEPPEIAGYRAVNQVTVELEEVARTGGVLDAALEAGANRAAGLTFFASDTHGPRLEALRQATDRARDEARAVAGALGLEIRAAETVQTGVRTPPPVFRGAVALEAAQAMDTPIEAGSQNVEATVTITFILAPAGAP
ncbi:MAG: SIMPL domain-containing protein [Longimicrobiales bacterium]|nr:SIMPL domain-containing protein [Longimicrobiales bacterium]